MSNRMMYSMNISGNFEFFLTGWMVENTFLQNHVVLRKCLWSVKSTKCFWFLICIAYYSTKNHILLLKVLQNYRAGPGPYHVVIAESYITSTNVAAAFSAYFWIYQLQLHLVLGLSRYGENVYFNIDNFNFSHGYKSLCVFS